MDVKGTLHILLVLDGKIKHSFSTNICNGYNTDSFIHHNRNDYLNEQSALNKCMQKSLLTSQLSDIQWSLFRVKDNPSTL